LIYDPNSRLVYGSQSKDIETFAAFEERLGDLTIWSCDSIHFQLEIPEYGVSKRVAERYHRAATTILIPKSFEHILTVSLGDAIAKLFNLPQAAMDIDKVLCTCGDALLLNDLFASIWSLPALPREWEEGLSKAAEIDESAFRQQTVDLTEMEDVQSSPAPNKRSFTPPPPSFASAKGPYIATPTPSKAKVQTVVRSNAFRNLVTSMTKAFITMAADEISLRLPNHPPHGVTKGVNLRGPISKERLDSYTAELQRTTSGSATVSVEDMEYTWAGIKSGLLGEYFVPLNHKFTIPLTKIYLLFNKCLEDFTYKNWTSCKRDTFGFPSRDEGDADFVYHDRDGKLGVLLGLGEPAVGGNIIYYLEVKSTGLRTKSFKLSHNQFQFVRLVRLNG
jgi:hypothetical protein